MSQEQFWWIWSLELWIPSDLELMENYFGRITLFSGKAEQETTGPKVITQKELNSSTLCLMSYGKRLRGVTVSRDFN